MEQKKEPSPPTKQEPKRLLKLSGPLALLLALAEPVWGKLLLMGLGLVAIGGTLTLSSWLTRDGSGEYKVWPLFWLTGGACLIGSVIAALAKLALRKRK